MADEQQTGDDRPRDKAKDGAGTAKADGEGKPAGGGDDKRDGDKDGDDKGSDDKAGDDKDGDGDDRASGPPLYKRPLFWIVLGIVTLVLAVGGLLWWLHARRFQSTDDAFVDTHIVRIAAETTGRLTAVADLDNRHVERGQVLAMIEASDVAATEAQAQAGIAQADAQIEQARARVLSAQASRRQAAANALAPEAEAARAARDYARYLTLRGLDPLAAAATQVDQARTQAQSSAAQALAARRQVETAEADVLAARKQIDVGRAQRRAAVAQLQQANVTASYLRIRAPIAGQVVNRQVNVGSYVAPGQQLLAIVPDRIWITANFKETQLALMRPGQPVRISIDAFPNVDFHGHVDSIQRGAGQAFQVLPPQNATGNYVKVVQRVPVRILFDGDDWRRYAIGPGMSAVPRVTVR